MTKKLNVDCFLNSVRCAPVISSLSALYMVTCSSGNNYDDFSECIPETVHSADYNE